MEDNFSDFVSENEMSVLNLSQVDPKQLEFERALEIVSQNIVTMLDQCFNDFPNVQYTIIQNCVHEISRFLSFHEVSQENELVDYIGRGLQSLIKKWTVIVEKLGQSKPSAFFPKIDELISSTYQTFKNLLSHLDEYFLTGALKYNIFPQIVSFDSYFIEKNQELRLKTKKLKIQLKLCPGVEPPQIKRVQIETYKLEKKPYTEWNTFSEEETVEIDKDPSCTMVPLLHRIFSMLSETKVSVVTYYAPVGWEVTRLSVYVVDGFFKSTNIKRTVCRENKGMAEIEVSFPRITRENVWCRVRLEGVISRKRIMDVKLPETKEIIVLVDENGEHELPDGFIDADDLD